MEPNKLQLFIFLAGLQSIPKSIIEASAIDGAKFWKRFITIIIPLLSPVSFFLFVMNSVYAFLIHLE